MGQGVEALETCTGGCHCGAVRFEIRAPAHLEVVDCNCSICSMSGYLHLIVPARSFTLVRGDDDLSEYRFNSGVARHLFCRHCGVKSFYIPRSNPDGVDVNLNCLDSRPRGVSVIQFDGRNWEKNAHTLAHKSR